MANWPQSEMTGNNRRYHCKMLLNTLRGLERHGDTRGYLDVDEPEQLILIQLLEKELNA